MYILFEYLSNVFRRLIIDWRQQVSCLDLMKYALNVIECRNLLWLGQVIKLLNVGVIKKIKYLEVKPKNACLSILTSIMVGNFFSLLMSSLIFYNRIIIWVVIRIINVLEYIDSKTLTWQILKMTYTWNPIHAWNYFN